MVNARVLGAAGLLLLTHCSAGKGNSSQIGADTGGHSGSSASAGSESEGGSTSTGGTPNLMLGGSSSSGSAGKGGSGGSAVDNSGCGDGVLQAAALGEVCDDGNSESGDGCSADCKVIEENYSCLTPGQKCVTTVQCGDGKVTGTETCDDGNTKAKDGCDTGCQLEMGWLCPTPGDLCVAAKCGDGIVAGVEQCEDNDVVPTSGDGCDASCALEPGFVCDMPGQACRKAVCGDGVVEGGEPCDDMNTVVGDGCSPGCEAEPICTKPSAASGCSSSCGDGILIDGDPSEECDDGNKRDGDGCSATCKVEAGYTCAKQQGALPASITIPFVFRDFISFPSASTTLKRHPDFQSRCINQQQNGMLNATLDAQGKPVNSGTCNDDVSCTLDLGPIDQNVDHCTAHESCSVSDGCDQLHGLQPIAGHPGDPFSFWYRTTDGVNKEKVVMTALTLANGKYSFNSGGLFPFDNDGWVKSGDEVTAGGHDWGFTTEVRRWFQFDGGEILTFNGDDDVWVYINGKLALDIGGLHGTEVRSIRLNANGTVDCKQGEPALPATTFDSLVNCTPAQRDLGLIAGKVYEIALFHAERHTFASNFRLSLSGFVSVKSKCSSVCGDGTQTPDEACDDGAMNDDNAYGGCTTKCKRGPRCGDGVQQLPQEACDDGKNLTPYSPTKQGCAPGCKLPNYCGDGKLDSLFGEKCDDGTNAGGYGGCNPDCTLGPRCGDGNIDEPTENCDDGNAVSGDGCSAKCVKEMPK